MTKKALAFWIVLEKRSKCFKVYNRNQTESFYFVRISSNQTADIFKGIQIRNIHYPPPPPLLYDGVLIMITKEVIKINLPP